MSTITSLPVLTSTSPADVVPVVDVDDFTQSAQGTTKQITVGNLIPATFYGNIFGNGSDGAVTLDGTTTYSGMSLAGSTYTLTRDIFTTALTINSGVTLAVGVFRVFCTGTVTNSGTISANGNAGLANGTAGAASSGSSGVLGAGHAGGAGQTGNGSAGGLTGIGVGVNQGGAGGAGSSGSGGSQGSANSASTWLLTPAALTAGVIGFSGTSGQIAGGGSGGGGGGDGTNKGGGGGGAAGIICIFAHAIVNNGTVTATGGGGGTPATGNCGGGGGGAGGLIIVFTLAAWTAGTTAVTGGAAGSGVGTGSAGNAGGAGAVVNLVMA